MTSTAVRQHRPEAPPTASHVAPPTASDVATPASGDRVGRVEAHGIDYIGDAERHGRARELLPVWAASNITYLYIVLGGTMILLGLNVWQAMMVVAAGNLFWLLVGWLSTSGPASGTPSEVVTRAIFGIRGNRVNQALVGWGISVAFEAINLSVGALAGFALVEQLGVHTSAPIKLAIVLGTAVVTFTISVYGHATIVKLSGWFTAVLLVSLGLLAVFVLQHAHLGYAPQDAPQGATLWAVALAGFTIIASGPLSWGTGADYARYLPASTSRRAIVGWTTLGGYVPSVLLGGLGVLAGTAVDMTDPQTSLKAILPSWFYPVFLGVIMLGSMTNNVLTAYSSGLALQSIGITWSRAVTVFFDGAVGVGICLYALFISNFLDTLNNLLELSVAVLGPSLAIYAVDILLRRNRYDGRQLHDESTGSPYWYQHGVNWAGVVAQLVGTAIALLCVNTTLVVGPIAQALDGADLSAVVGPLLGAGVYATATLYQRRARRYRGSDAQIAPIENRDGDHECDDSRGDQVGAVGRLQPVA